MVDESTISLDEARQRQKSAPAYQALNPNYRVGKLLAIDPLEWVDGKAPERRWVVQDMVPSGNVTMLGGDGGVGKSLLAMQLLTAAATGKGWLGFEAMRCKVLGIFAEDDHDELRRRQERINEHLGIAMADLGDMALVSRVAADSVMMDFGRDGYEHRDRGTAAEFFQRVHDLAMEHGAQIVVLDALHDYFAGNESVRVQVRQFVSLLRSLAIDIDGAVVLCAHPSLSGLLSGSGTSGSTAWNNAVRSRLYLTRPPVDDEIEPDPDKRVLKVMKANYGPDSGTYPLRYDKGVFVREGGAGGVFDHIEKRAVETVFLEALDALAKQGRQVNASPNHSYFAPKVMAGMPGVDGLGQPALRRAMEQLFHDGRVVLAETGPPSKRVKHIALAKQEDLEF